MKKLKKVQCIYDPIFGQNYYFVNCKTHKDFQKICLKELDIAIENREDFTSGGQYSIITKDDIDICLFWADRSDVEVVVHESFHATSSVLRDRGISLTDSSEEVFAYLLQYIVKEVLSGKSYNGN